MAVPIFTYNNGRGEGGDTGRYVGQSIQVGFYLFSGVILIENIKMKI